MIKNIARYAKNTLQHHPLIAGLVVAIVFTLLFNLNALFAVVTLPALLSILPCLLMVGLCMKSMGGKTACEQKAPDQSLLTQRLSKTQVVDQESHHA
jgi:predicted tellurium resistance membrane protein TerC